jgi:hypothetical protein
MEQRFLTVLVDEDGLLEIRRFTSKPAILGRAALRLMAGERVVLGGWLDQAQPGDAWWHNDAFLVVAVSRKTRV